MNDYTNAAPSPSALFDNVPTVTAAQPPHLTPATRISQIRGGRWVAVDVFMQYGAPVPVDLAIKRVAIGRTVFVRREDAGAVLEAVGGTDGQTSRLDA